MFFLLLGNEFLIEELHNLFLVLLEVLVIIILLLLRAELLFLLVLLLAVGEYLQAKSRDARRLKVPVALVLTDEVWLVLDVVVLLIAATTFKLLGASSLKEQPVALA